MDKRTLFFVILILLIPITAHCQQSTIHIATDQAYWYPFTYSQGSQAKGIHIDMVQKALSNLNYAVKFYPRPWKRCLQETKDGKYNAIVSASYRPERAQYLIYPDDAAAALKSLWRITQVEYIVITHSDDAYIFDGDVKSLPQPVRAPLGYSIADDLKSAGIPVLEAPGIIDCARQLVESGRGAFVTPPQNAVELQLDKRFMGKLKLHPKPIKSKSYFMAFSIENQKLKQEEIVAIWNEIARLREDQDFMKALFNKYDGEK
ncbi:MAG: transporter substrate-binding domain-containing protein [Proteobacteria bacterium]|nr:transporter substrate-binding domain-containing protein [Pseudomonadota bacterium]MBU1582206.1 transporter substrate-binding domain-containing protein [Pseudomonadota bacterium]MBU2452104.1 transporter substrate-binding domain-containing protein [Pseudomonadota bacterium]MBU2627074.1 transporter substrate-binding domain-containing protein [Pseudomonadota bacterium]